MATDLDPTTARRAGHWVIGTFHGHHGGTNVLALAARNDSAPLPYGRECTCGIGQRLPAEDGVWDSA
ncbi:hypothetical protein [Streptomyces sp. MA15]|uniref:hypothetical protein n=1 Tax=Streptomyces sp. MA15 TaxID=3055061 RepID=UPI0025B2402C|nr:hypothetical protein [Streptomyces sp. MA15]MDN3271448.1 hypothetical protein [Streptomyces sp. MA15]